MGLPLRREQMRGNIFQNLFVDFTFDQLPNMDRSVMFDVRMLATMFKGLLSLLACFTVQCPQTHANQRILPSLG